MQPKTLIVEIWFAVGVCLLVGTQQVSGGWGFFHMQGKAEEVVDENDYIFPGTLWCGPGNIATNTEDLGQFNDTDECCRNHDRCPDVIAAGGSKHGLVNNASYTRVHCPCDDAFYSCLKKVDSLPSNQVGRIYFTLLNTQCFREEHPIVSCKTYYPSLKWRCKEYDLDDEADRQWQWFDVPVY